MKNYLEKVLAHQYLTEHEAYSAMQAMGSGNQDEAILASFITAMMMRPVGVEELNGFRKALLDLCTPISFEQDSYIDLCGTGGDGKNTFNISTLSSFVAAGAGVKVAKHGNYGVSSVSGSSNVLEYLGIQFTNKQDELQRQLNEAGICFLHAPLFHPALKNVGPIRKKLGVKTFFNILGPMVNPARPNKQLVGVFNLEVARNYNYVFQKSDKDYLILHALDGYDEISGTGPVKYYGNTGEGTIYPDEFLGRLLKEEELHSGDSVESAARIFIEVLENKGTEAQQKIVCMNAAAAIHLFNKGLTMQDAYAMATESLESGAALRSFQKLHKTINA
ncbi:MAG: anthranilate phosphoribosyltransferase [Luteibaculum sp.]